MSAGSREKGKNGERELTGVFREAGWHVGQGQRNLRGECDLRAELGGVRLHVECKRQERLRIPEWITQAETDAAPGTTPTVVFRQNRGRWYAVLTLKDLLEMIG